MLYEIEEIKFIEFHKKIELNVNGVKVCNVLPDFEITTKNGNVFYADAKVYVTETALSNLKFKIFQANFNKKIFKLPKELNKLINEIRKVG